MKKLTRREFVAGALAGVAAAAVPVKLLSAGSSANKKTTLQDVIRLAKRTQDYGGNWIWDPNQLEWIRVVLPRDHVSYAKVIQKDGTAYLVPGMYLETKPLKLPPGMEVKNFHDLFCYTDIAVLPDDYFLNELERIQTDGHQNGDLRSSRMFSLPFDVSEGKRGELTNEIDRNHKLVEASLVRKLYLDYLDFEAYKLRTGTKGRFAIRLPSQEFTMSLTNMNVFQGKEAGIVATLHGMVKYYLLERLPEGAEWPMQQAPVAATRPWHDVYRFFSCSRVFDRHQCFVRDIKRLLQTEFV